MKAGFLQLCPNIHDLRAENEYLRRQLQKKDEQISTYQLYEQYLINRIKKLEKEAEQRETRGR